MEGTCQIDHKINAHLDFYLRRPQSTLDALLRQRDELQTVVERLREEQEENPVGEQGGAPNASASPGANLTA